ncbi:SUMF1/EgtB/PvdO family nonheme iron enzyme [Streptomyces sp. NPDC046976]|uniref:SUMF1/EgtB/PvdO family nonheme iron enzyme n=1 Tax=Streptomyces sp. NPDC046976 TaxID=3155258 RepID=UPI003402B2C5
MHNPTPSTSAPLSADRARVLHGQQISIPQQSGAATVEDVAEQVAGLYGRGAVQLAPVLALGVFERVGSNWVSDTLREVMPQHNEPFRQQLGRAHPLSPCNRAPVELDGTELGALGRHHLACALADLYGRPRHLVKETNLVFATDTVLRLLPHSPVVVLTRAPVGIASSFERGRLWARWAYGQRYAQVAATAASARWRDFAALVPLDDPAPPVALARLIALNSLLLAQALSTSGRAVAVVSYEQHVSDRNTVLSELADHLGVTLPVSDAPQAGSPTHRAAVDSTFVTTGGKGGLVAEISCDTADMVSSHVAAALERAGTFLDAGVTARAAGWLAGDDQYEVCAPTAGSRPVARAQAPAVRVPEATYHHVAEGVTWRSQLVTNAEMADLLTLLHAAGLPNTCLGTNLFVCPMPHERGGRLHFDARARRWRVSPGYESHPAYWVTWLGAATVAAWLGARLPTRAEATRATAGTRAYNTNYAVGDASSVLEPGRSAGDVHHLVGNVQIWCGDGPDLRPVEPVRRYLFGAAWNTPGTADAIRAVRSRYLLGSSRGVGVRPVRDGRTSAATGLGAWELAHHLNAWIDGLDPDGGPARSLGELDRLLISAVTGS